MQKNKLPIGVFDSGIGGLTVLRALQHCLPHESFLYLGDTARLPYGTKSANTVMRYAEQATKKLHEQGIKLLVVACNTASAVALEHLETIFHNIPVIGVIKPGAHAACEASNTGHIIVAATEGTVNQCAYQHAIHHIWPDAKVTSQACAMFVALAEEGWIQGEIVEQIVGHYLLPLFTDNKEKADCLVLGCTHFPVLKETIQKVLGKDITIVDSATTTANIVARELELQNILNDTQQQGDSQFLVTDAPARFSKLARYFLQVALRTEDISLIDV